MEAAQPSGLPEGSSLPALPAPRGPSPSPPLVRTAAWGSCRLSLVRFQSEAYLFLDELGRFGRVARILPEGRGLTVQVLLGDREDLDAAILYKHMAARLALPGLLVFDGLKRRKYPELRGLVDACGELTGA